ncbi:MAG: hypothetical protein C5B60_09680, partial [Chloroflexi bacterium]
MTATILTGQGLNAELEVVQQGASLLWILQLDLGCHPQRGGLERRVLRQVPYFGLKLLCQAQQKAQTGLLVRRPVGADMPHQAGREPVGAGS